MSKITFGLVGLCVAAATCGSAFGAEAPLLTHKDLTLASALTIGVTAIETCKKQGYKVTAQVLSRDGSPLVTLRGDGTGPATPEVALKKAFTSLAFKMSSAEFAKVFPAPIPLTNIISAGGGLPIVVGDELVGAIGVSGAPGGDKDEACGKAGIDKFAESLK